MTSALDMPEIMSYIYSKSWKLQFSASSSIIIIEDYYLQTFLHSLEIFVNYRHPHIRKIFTPVPAVVSQKDDVVKITHNQIELDVDIYYR